MIDICMALDQSVSPHTGVRTIQNTGVFWQAVFQPPRPYSFFLEHGSAAKTLISHPHNTASYAGYIKLSYAGPPQHELPSRVQFFLIRKAFIALNVFIPKFNYFILSVFFLWFP